MLPYVTYGMFPIRKLNLIYSPPQNVMVRVSFADYD